MVVWSTACLILVLFGKEKPIIALRDICTKCKLHWSSKLRVDCQMISNPESIDSKTMKFCRTVHNFFFSVATDFKGIIQSTRIHVFKRIKMKNGKKKTNLCQTLLNLSDLLDLSIGYIQHNKGQNDYDTLTAKKSISP